MWRGFNDKSVIIETSGSIDALCQSVEIIDRRGRIVIVGAYGKEALLPMDLTVRKDLTVLGSWLYPHLFQECD
jgi:threonine dehydrogenase-like Zn-dependent dehydrogenase